MKEREMLPYCKAHGIGIIPWSPLSEGYLARPLGIVTQRMTASRDGPFEMKLSAEDRKVIGSVEELAERKGWSMAEVALAWVCAKATSPIVGFSSVCHSRKSTRREGLANAYL
jgi:aryl-alcohol dehydrogenase-like predicted oxidoreductase